MSYVFTQEAGWFQANDHSDLSLLLCALCDGAVIRAVIDTDGELDIYTVDFEEGQ